MTDSFALSNLLEPVITEFNPTTILTAGQTASACVKNHHDTVLHHLTTPYSQQQFAEITPVDLAIISHLTESLPQTAARHWLGTMKNLYAPHLILISHAELAQQQGWQLTDFLALGLKHLAGSHDGLQIFSYAIETYQFKRDWLNSRFWANPELYDKYHW